MSMKAEKKTKKSPKSTSGNIVASNPLGQSLGIDPQMILSCFKNPFLIFDQKGMVNEFFHPEVKKFLEDLNPANMNYFDLLSKSDEEKSNYSSWVDLLFNETLSFDEAADLGPTEFKMKDPKKYVRLEYRPLRGPEGNILAIMVLFCDETKQVEMQREREKREMRSKFLLKAFTFKTQFVDFIAELKLVIFRLREFGNAPTPENILEAKRLLHTLTGATSYFHLSDLEKVCRETENAIRRADISKKTDLAKIFLSACLKFNELYQALYREYSPVLGKPAFNNQISREVPLKKLELFYQKLMIEIDDSELQFEFLNEFVKLPIAQMFMHFEGVIQDTATLLAKKVKPLKIIGDHILIYETPYKNLFASFIHIFNNVIDHGIEDPYSRKRLDKPTEGLITVEIKKDQDDFIQILISDDGKGIDVDLIKRKLEVNNINYSFLSDDEILQTVFLPDFTTKDNVGKVSGRGIGLNAVADELEKIGGSVTVASRPGLGVTFHIQIPILSLDGEPV